MTVLEELHLHELRETQREMNDWNRGGEAEILEAARERVEQVEELRRKLAARGVARLPKVPLRVKHHPRHQTRPANHKTAGQSHDRSML
ncbi:hypothetical protein [Nonomuraea bangladeshensis]|uniref:hypothetical protein n=1 Tax=Nonomuraea bangladeshensis TaxID=404385 RepID=UPI0031D2E52C